MIKERKTTTFDHRHQKRNLKYGSGDIGAQPFRQFGNFSTFHFVKFLLLK